MSADRNLLYGMLALHNGFVTREQLLEAMHAWMLHKATPLGELLRQQGVLRDDDLRLLDGLVERQLSRPGDAALRVDVDVCRELSRLGDAEVQASLQSLGLSPETTPPGDSVVPPTDYNPVAVPAGGWMRYRVLRPHARGGLGEVSVALDEELQREVALKQIQDRFADNKDNRNRFVREALITGHLEHPGIVPVYGLLTLPDGRPTYAMRFIRGESLHDAIGRFHAADVQPRRDLGERSLALRGLLTRFVTVCNAVAFAHSRGILHRDLKPANVMLGDFGETLVVDWGLAKVLADTDPERTTLHRPVRLAETEPTQLGQVMGTPAYMSPEQARGEHDRLDARSDTWALGATLYALLTGKPPYRARDVLAQAARGAFAPPRVVKRSVPVALEAVCLKAMALEPAERYATACELGAEVERWLADEAVQAYREPWHARARRWGRRHRTLVTSAMVLLAASVVALGVGLWAVNEEKQRTAQNLARALLAEQQANENFEQARQERDRAVQAEKKATTHFEWAREAVDDCFGTANEDGLFRQENMRAARKKLLEKTLPFYERFVAVKADDDTLLVRQAKYLFRVGYITAEIDRQAHALKSYEQARDVYLRLRQAHPEVTQYQEALARTWANLGGLQSATGQRQEALKSHEQARDLWQRLVKDHPGVTNYKADLGRHLEQPGHATERGGEVAGGVKVLRAGQRPAATPGQSPP